MPPKTRRGPAKVGQSTLSFKNKITKQNDSTTALKNAKAQLNEPAQEIVTEEIVKQSTPEPEPAKQTGKGKATEAESPVRIVPSPARRKVRKSQEQIDREVSFAEASEEAQKLSDARIKKYWKAIEDERMTPQSKQSRKIRLFVLLTSSTVHQEGVHLHEKILRHFDLSAEFGPCIGHQRSSRWKRAHRLGQQPPMEVLAVILKEEAKGTKRDTGRIAYIDELAGGRDSEILAGA